MIGRLVTDDVDQWNPGAMSVVEISQPIGEPRATVEQRRRRAPGQPGIAVGRARSHSLEKDQGAVYAWNTIQRPNEMHLARARIGEADADIVGNQRVYQTFCAVHRVPDSIRLDRQWTWPAP